MKMLLLLWMCFIWFQWTHHLATADLLSVARTYCPFSDFCTLKRADDSFNPTDKETPCCSPCSCDSTCWKLGNCCPDIDEVTSAKSAAYEFDCIHTKYDYFGKPEPTFIGPRYTNYRIITTCPEDYEDTTTVNKCVNSTQFMPESYDDIVVVSDADNHDIIFMNKYCAECNDVENIERWTLVTGSCGLYSLAETSLAGPDLYKYIITECDVMSEPSSNIQLTFNVFCSEDMISECNVTGNWDVYDAEIERACDLWYTPFFEAHKRYTTIKAIYQNPFCHHCNDEVGLATVDECLNDDIDGTRGSVTTVSFTALMDLSLTLSNLEKQNEVTGICAINEIYSDIDGICRRLYCPVNENSYNGQCLANSLDMSGLVVQVKIAVIPTEPLIFDGIDAFLDENKLQLVQIDLLRHMQLALCDMCTSSGVLTHISNGIYSDIKQIVFELRIATNKRCNMDRIETSLKVGAQHKQFKLETKQNTVQSVINILYYGVDTPNTEWDLNASITNHFSLTRKNRLCDTNFKITPVFFCPFVTFTEEEYFQFLNASHATTAGDPRSHQTTNVDNKIFRMSSFNSSLQGRYATCIENLYSNPNNKCVRCCCTFYIPFLVGVVLAVHVF